MTQGQLQIRAEAEEAARDFAELIATEQDTSGIPAPPNIEISETSLDEKPFGLNLTEEPTAEAFPNDDIPPPPLPSCSDCGFTHELLDGRYFLDVSLDISNFQTITESGCDDEPDDTICEDYAYCYTLTASTAHCDGDGDTTIEAGEVQTDFYRAFCLDEVCGGASIILSQTLGYLIFSGDPCAQCGQASGQTLSCELVDDSTIQCSGTFDVNNYTATFIYTNECTP